MRSLADIFASYLKLLKCSDSVEKHRSQKRFLDFNCEI